MVGLLACGLENPWAWRALQTVRLGKVYVPAQICRVLGVQSTGTRAGIFSNNVLLVIADIILKRVANYIYIPIYSTISRIPTTLRYSPLLSVSKNGRVEIITIDQSDAAFGLNLAEVSGFCKSTLANSPAHQISQWWAFLFYCHIAFSVFRPSGFRTVKKHSYKFCFQTQTVPACPSTCYDYYSNRPCLYAVHTHMFFQMVNSL